MEKEKESALERLEKNSEKQLKNARLQSVMAVISALCFTVLVIAVLVISPKLIDLCAQADTIAADVQELLVQADTVLTNLETVTGELADADLAGTIEGISGLVSESQDNLSGAFDKLNSIDIESLNLAIEALGKVIEPISRFFGVFGG